MMRSNNTIAKVPQWKTSEHPDKRYGERNVDKNSSRRWRRQHQIQVNRLPELRFYISLKKKVIHRLLSSQSLDFVPKKLNLTQQQQTFISEPKNTITQNKH